MFDDLKTALGQFNLAAQRVAMTVAAIERQAPNDAEVAAICAQLSTTMGEAGDRVSTTRLAPLGSGTRP
jgi:hypothetical protein